MPKMIKKYVRLIDMLDKGKINREEFIMRVYYEEGKITFEEYCYFIHRIRGEFYDIRTV